MEAPIACPACNTEIKIRNHEGEWYCVGCRRWHTPEYLDACDRCSQLDAVMYSPNYIQIKPRRGTDDARLIALLFEKKDRRYSFWHGWMISNLPKYAYLKCVQQATSAFLKQSSFLELV